MKNIEKTWKRGVNEAEMEKGSGKRPINRNFYLVLTEDEAGAAKERDASQTKVAQKESRSSLKNEEDSFLLKQQMYSF